MQEEEALNPVTIEEQKKILGSKGGSWLEGVETAYLKRMLCVSKCTPNRITYILADTSFFIEDLMAAHNLVPTPQSTRFLEQEAESKKCTPRTSQHSCNDKQRMEWSQLPAAPPVHESCSPRITPPYMRNQGIPQPQQRMPMHPMQRTVHIVECTRRT